MKFWLSLVTVPEVEQLPQIAAFAEEVGFYGATVADHLVMPAQIKSKYPYTPDGEVFWPLETPWPDPFITLTAMGAATQKLQLMTNIYLAALRDPFTAARAVATAAVFTNNRVRCGVSAGWIKEEYDVAGVDFATRGKRLDEMLTVLRKLWTGEIVSHAGEHFRFEDVIMRPVPDKRIPIWCGGDAAPALRRVVRNDGWLALPMTLEKTASMLETVRQMRRDTGLPMEAFEMAIPLVQPLTPDTLGGLKGLGVDQMMIISPWMPTPWDVAKWVDDGADTRKLDVKKKALERFANTVIARA